MNKKTAGMNWALVFFSCLLIVTYQLPLLQLRVSYASNLSGAYQSSSMVMIDLYTQKEPYSGKGPNQPSDAFAPQEEVILYTNVTNNGKPEQSRTVNFEIYGPTNPLENITFVRNAITNASGVANTSFRIPWPPENAETIIFGIWSAVALVEIEEETVMDTLTFKVGWIVEIVSIWTINENFQPQTRFAKGTCVGVEMMLRNIAMTPKNATFTLAVYDNESQPIAYTALEDVEVELGETSMRIVCELQIPKWAFSGYAVLYANAFGAVPYCPEVSTGFLITLCDVAVISVTPSLTEVYAGEVVNITVIVGNEGRETETFNVTVYYDDAVVGTQTVTNLTLGALTSLNFNWDTRGVPGGDYVIKAVASTVLGETDIGDNTKIDGTVTVKPVRDVAVISVIPVVTEVDVGEVVNVTVTAKNEGSVTESFEVTLYYDDAVVGTQTVTNLAFGTETTLKFNWDTTGVTPDVSYTMKAEASVVLGETDIGDNTKIDGTVTVKSPPVYVFPRELAIGATIVASAIGLTLLVILLYRRRRRKSGFQQGSSLRLLSLRLLISWIERKTERIEKLQKLLLLKYIERYFRKPYNRLLLGWGGRG